METVSILTLVISTLVFIWSIISFIVLNKQKKEILKLEKKLETSNYVSNRRFDLELDLYREFNNQITIVLNKTFLLFPEFDDSSFGKSKGEEKFKIGYDMYVSVTNETNKLLSMLYANQAFIDDKLYEEILELTKLVRTQTSIFKGEYVDRVEDFIVFYEKDSKINVYDRYKLISEMRMSISSKIKSRLDFILDN